MATLAVLFFAATALALTAYAIGPFGLAEEDRPPLQAALLWIILFFAAATGLPRAFVPEEETGTALALRKTLPAALVLAGKALFNFGLFLAIAAVAVPGFLILLDWRVARRPRSPRRALRRLRALPSSRRFSRRCRRAPGSGTSSSCWWRSRWFSRCC